MNENRIGSRKLVLDRETLRELDPDSLEIVAGGDISETIPIITTLVNTIVPTLSTVIVVSVTIVASSPCSNVYSHCGACRP